MTIAPCFAATLLALIPQEGASPPDEGPPEVELTLVAGAVAVLPGSELLLGARLAMPPDWHVYWENPGDSGMQTRARLEAPAGFAVEGPLFPGPQRIELSGGLVSYGYEGEAMLLFRVRAPAKLEPGREVRFSVQADWLVCKEACFLGRGEAELALPVAEAGAAPAAPPAGAAVIERHARRLPRPWAKLERARASWSLGSEDTGEGARLELALSIPSAQGLEVFPAASDALALVDRALEGEPGKLRLVLTYALEPGADPGGVTARGVLRVDRDGESTFHRFDLPVELAGG